MTTQWETVWAFHTRNFTIKLQITPCLIDPSDCFENEDDIKAIHEENVLWFDARVSVEKNNHEIGSDCLGGCAYESVSDFYESHRDANPMNRNCSLMRAAKGSNVAICDYFPDMVRQAIADARHTLQTS